MSRIFITGSADGLGQLAARQLVQQHQVVLHARSPARAAEAQAAVPEAETVVVGDLSTLAGMHQVAEQVNALGRFDAVIHNAGVYQVARLVYTADGWPALLAINTLAPYVLTCLIERPARLVYLSSGMHRQGDASLRDLTWQQRPWNTMQAYCDSKLHDLLLSNAVARPFTNPIQPFRDTPQHSFRTLNPTRGSPPGSPAPEKQNALPDIRKGIVGSP